MSFPFSPSTPFIYLKLLPRLPHPILHPIPPDLSISHHAHRAPLHHQAHDLKQHIRRRHRRMFSICIVGGCYFHDIGRDEIDAFEAADDGAEFASGPAAGFGCACCGSNYTERQ